MSNNKKIYVFLLFLIILVGVFSRSFHFSDWLHFELDQSRDAKIINLAIEEGPESLPLLGPKAAGSFLRLGPIFYYFKYVSALIFGNTPAGMAVIIMIFGIMAIPAFYILVKRYFSDWISLSLLSIFATSLFLVMYSRFSWNPNALALFVILVAYALLRAVDIEEKKRGWWLLAASFFLAISVQLHFLAFVSIPAIASIFLIIKRPRIKWSYWLGAVAIIFIMNLPVILNESKTGGGNIGEFQKVVLGKTNKNSEKTLPEKIFKNYTENSLGYFLILSSQNAELPGLSQKDNFDIKCDQKCRDGLLFGLIALLFFSSGILLLFRNLFFEKERKKKDFLILTTIWLTVVFILFVPLSFDIAPRFWLLASFLPIIFLGFLLEFLGKNFPKKIALTIIITIILVLISSNIYKIQERFGGLSKAPIGVVDVSADRILKEKNRVTLEQQIMIIDYIESFYKKNGYPISLNSDSYYRRSFLFHLDTRNIPRISNSSQIYRKVNYFLIYPTMSNLEKETNKYVYSHNIVEKKQFGTLVVIRLEAKPEAIVAEEQEPRTEKKSESAPGVPKRYTWEEIFNEDGEENTEE